MRNYVTMEELSRFINKGTHEFLEILNGKTMSYTKFKKEFDKVYNKYQEMYSKSYGYYTNKQQEKIGNDYQAYTAVDLLMKGTQFMGTNIDENLVLSMIANYDKEKVLKLFDKMGYEHYMKGKTANENDNQFSL